MHGKTQHSIYTPSDQLASLQFYSHPTSIITDLLPQANIITASSRLLRNQWRHDSNPSNLLKLCNNRYTNYMTIAPHHLNASPYAQQYQLPYPLVGLDFPADPPLLAAYLPSSLHPYSSLCPPLVPVTNSPLLDPTAILGPHLMIYCYCSNCGTSTLPQ